jgi:hypothetical protein
MRPRRALRRWSLSVTLRHLPMGLNLFRLALVDHYEFVARFALCS